EDGHDAGAQSPVRERHEPRIVRRDDGDAVPRTQAPRREPPGGTPGHGRHARGVELVDGGHREDAIARGVGCGYSAPTTRSSGPDVTRARVKANTAAIHRT